MNRYRVQLHGKNFLVDLGDGLGLFGFYTYRDVDAQDEHSAELMAVQMVREDSELRQMVKNAANDPPAIHLEELFEIEERNDTQPGLVWYPAKSWIPWWKFWRR